MLKKNMLDMWSWLGRNYRQIQIIVVIIVALVTYQYATSTKKMADVMYEEYIATSRPYLSITIHKIKEAEDETTIEYRITNVGKLPSKVVSATSGIRQLNMHTSKLQNDLIFPEDFLTIPGYIGNDILATLVRTLSVDIKVRYIDPNNVNKEFFTVCSFIVDVEKGESEVENCDME